MSFRLPLRPQPDEAGSQSALPCASFLVPSKAPLVPVSLIATGTKDTGHSSRRWFTYSSTPPSILCRLPASLVTRPIRAIARNSSPTHSGIGRLPWPHSVFAGLLHMLCRRSHRQHKVPEVDSLWDFMLGAERGLLSCRNNQSGFSRLSCLFLFPLNLGPALLLSSGDPGSALIAHAASCGLFCRRLCCLGCLGCGCLGLRCNSLTFQTQGTYLLQGVDAAIDFGQ